MKIPLARPIPMLTLMATMMTATATAAPMSAGRISSDTASMIEKAQVGVYFGVGPYYRPYRPYYRPYYGYRRDYYGGPPVTYYETRPYVVQRAVPQPYGDPDAIARCASQFRSFNANTGTYVTYGGEERLCPYLR